MRILNGLELAGYVKERQAKQVRALRQSWRVTPKLAIVRTSDNPVIDTYVKLKKAYGEDIGVEAAEYRMSSSDLITKIEELNSDESIHGIIIQLPLADDGQVESAVNAVTPDKDVDGLGKYAKFTPATAMAIDWLIAGYDVDLNGKKIAIVGNGRLVGAPLAKLWIAAGFDVEVYNRQTVDLAQKVANADVIVTATGVPGLIIDSMVRKNAILIDAGTAAEHGKIVGDVEESVRNRQDLTITPIKGGVGPLTVVALFDNVILSARRVADIKGQQDI
jgi:methylenetetrahydrofolate dehydrogenase (NADP+)/methenyltetrahydrofolate cyclohydrolase